MKYEVHRIKNVQGTGKSRVYVQLRNGKAQSTEGLLREIEASCTLKASDVMAVMTQLEKKLPLLLALGTKVQVSAEGMIVRPTVSGSLTQSQLKAKLEARKAAGEDVDVNREITAADLTTKDLTAGVAIDFSKKFNAAFAQNGTFKRVGDAATDATTSPDASGGTSGGDQKPPSEVEG